MATLTQTKPSATQPQAPRPDLIRRIPYSFAKKHGVLLMNETSQGFEVWARPGLRATIIAELQRALRKPIRIRETAPDVFEFNLNTLYETHMEKAADVAQDFEKEPDVAELAKHLPRAADLLESENDAPVVRLINALLSQALREKVSDIHLEPFETRVVIRFRSDGVLRDVIDLQKALHGLVVSRIKILSGLDIAEKRLPQDGRFSLQLAGKAVDVRVSTLLTGNGERVVLRLLDKQAGRLTLSSLGVSARDLKELDDCIHKPHGIFLVTGPTGSGKTTTLYAALSQLNTKHHNIMTVEDPIEYALEGVGQTQVNTKTNLTFARALRAILRQDPDIVMIGEIRDLETAQIAVQASLTGHLVLATLHTNDAIGVVTRLHDMGLEPFLVASSLTGVLAQRLIRKLCPDCRDAHAMTAAEKKILQSAGMSRFDFPLYRPRGCSSCNQTGYQGRTGLFELLKVDDDMRRLIHDRQGENIIRDHALNKGMTRLRHDGLRWVQTGVTSLEEILRVTTE